LWSSHLADPGKDDGTVLSEKPDTGLVAAFSARRLTLYLILGALTLTSVSAVAQYLDITSGNQSRLLPLLFVGQDQSVPSWYASIVLFSCSVLAAMIARSGRSGSGASRGWLPVAAIFAYLSVDEAVSIHEKFSRLGRFVLNAADIDSFVSRAWTIPALVVLILLMPFFIWFLAGLPGRFRILLVAAAVVYVGGAVGMELLTDFLVDMRGGVQDLTRSENVARIVVLPHFEELLEMFGIVLFVYALLRYLGEFAGAWNLRIDR
jgi:hypothetical protein